MTSANVFSTRTVDTFATCDFNVRMRKYASCGPRLIVDKMRSNSITVNNKYDFLCIDNIYSKYKHSEFIYSSMYKCIARCKYYNVD